MVGAGESTVGADKVTVSLSTDARDFIAICKRSKERGKRISVALCSLYFSPALQKVRREGLGTAVDQWKSEGGG